MSSKLKNVVFSLIPLFVLVTGLEVGLRIVNFKYSSTPLEMLSAPGWGGIVSKWDARKPNTQIRRFMKDPYQVWVPVPENSFEKNYSLEKKPGTVRIGALGDSCTQACVDTDSTFPGHLERALNESSAARYEVLNAGVGSHSSYQGFQRFKHAVLKFKPDIITVYFGWNDHWWAFFSDSDLKFQSDLKVAVINVLEKSRTYQAYHYLIDHLRKKFRPGEQPLLRLRVSMGEYEKNLNDIVDLAQANGIKVLLITAPSDHSKLKPFQNWPFPAPLMIETHERYNDIVRKVASARGVPLLDLSAIVAKEPPDSVISQDGVHFTPAGCKYAADRILEKLRELEWVGK